MDYETLLDTAYKEGITVYEDFLSADSRLKGLYSDGVIALRCNLSTSAEKSCILAEELGHHYTSYGNIFDMKKTDNRKQEMRARIRGYNLKIGLLGIIRAYEAGCRSLYEMAEFLDATEEFVKETIQCYRSKYGEYTQIDNYIVYFIPTLSVGKILE